MSILSNIKQNWKSGVSVAMVSIPLSFSLAIAAGASPMTGIITAAWAGLVAGIIGGSQYNIVGPAGALTGILIGYALQYGPEILPILAIVSGVMILIAWIFRWDAYLIFVPSSVIHGFTLGVALTIAFGQLNAILGLSGLPVHESLLANISESFRHIGAAQYPAYLTFFSGLVILFALLKYKSKWPNAILVALGGMLLGYVSLHGWIPFSIQTVGTKFPHLTGNLFAFPHPSTILAHPALASLGRLAQAAAIIKAALIIGFVAVLETLISAKTADGMTKTKFRQRREVFGLGLANIASGLFGGLPASGVFARTALNVKSGATSQYSQMINALAVGGISVLFIGWFNYLPLSIAAAILVYAAIRMVAAEHFKKLFRFDRSAFAVSLFVAMLTIVYDATMGILAGALVSLLMFANMLSKVELGSEADPENFNPEDEKEQAIIYRFAGALTYLNAKSYIERITQIRVDKPLILNFRHVHFIDVDGYESLDEIVDMLEHRGQRIFVAGIKPEMLRFFEAHAWFRSLSDAGSVVSSSQDALARL